MNYSKYSNDLLKYFKIFNNIKKDIFKNKTLLNELNNNDINKTKNSTIYIKKILFLLCDGKKILYLGQNTRNTYDYMYNLITTIEILYKELENEGILENILNIKNYHRYISINDYRNLYDKNYKPNDIVLDEDFDFPL